MMNTLSRFREVWSIDFEFDQKGGGLPAPLCLVARELFSNKVIRLFGEELNLPEAPFSTDENSLVVAFYSSAEMGCFLALGWPIPARVLDLYPEFRNITCGLPIPSGNGLLGAMSYFGLDAISTLEKESMRDLVLRGGPYTEEERVNILDYCESDVDSLVRLLPRMLPHIDLPRALLRGRFMQAAARIERHGVPMDMLTLQRLRKNWENMKSRLIERRDTHGLWDDGVFKADRLEAFLRRNGIAWPTTPSGRLSLDDNTFREMCAVHPFLTPIRELRHALSSLRLNDLQVGEDGRNRYLLSAFASKTGRNQPSNTKSIFGPAVWLRGLIKPPKGRAIAYLDYEQQEFGIAAALSGDEAMLAAYISGDPYLAFAKQAGAVPADATKDSHPQERRQFKECALGVQYGMSARSLAVRLREPEVVARRLLRLHRETYARFWEWSEAQVDSALLGLPMQTVFGWTLRAGNDPNPRSLANFPMQANGAEMLRLACCLATERGIMVCAPVHDALLIEAPIDEIESAVEATESYMREASQIVLDGFEIRTEAKAIRYPDRYQDERGAEMWSVVMGILDELESLP